MSKNNDKFCQYNRAVLTKNCFSTIFVVVFSVFTFANSLAYGEENTASEKASKLPLNQTQTVNSDAAEQTGISETGEAAIESIAQQLGTQSQADPLNSENEFGLIDYDISRGAEPLDVPLANINPVTVLSPELRENLALQFQSIERLKETEDAYSEQLGESYLAYGRALMQAGRVDEARKMLVNALHIAKINNGVNSIEQRPILRELFEMNFALQNIEETEAHLRRIIWLEKKDPKLDDVYSFDMVTRLGNLYLDLYINNPVISELSLDYLNKSTRYLSYAVHRYGNRPLSEILLPYGELALAHQLKSRIQLEVDRTAYQDSRRRGGFSDFGRSASRRTFGNSFAQSESYLRDYLRKAKRERDLVNTIHALMGLGDLALLSDRTKTAEKYYDLAWSGAQSLPLTHPIVESFNKPVKLPSFRFSVIRKPAVSSKPVELVPLSINIERDGRVRKVAPHALSEATTAMTGRARRIIKRARFRPIIENGELVPVNDFNYEVPVATRKSKAVASKDSAE